MRILVCGFLLFTLAGCNKDTHEKITTRYLAVMTELMGVCENIKDAESAKSNQKKISSLIDELKGLQGRLSELGEADSATRVRIEKKFDSEFTQLKDRFPEAMKRLEDPKVKKVLESEIKTLARMMHARL